MSLQLPEDGLDSTYIAFSADLELVFIGSYILQTRVAREPLSLPVPLLPYAPWDPMWLDINCAFSACGRFFAAIAPGIVGLSVFEIDMQQLSHKCCDLANVIDTTADITNFVFDPRRCQLAVCSIRLVAPDSPVTTITFSLLDLEASPVQLILKLERSWQECDIQPCKLSIINSSYPPLRRLTLDESDA